MDPSRIAEIRPETQKYYDRMSIDHAVEIAWEKIEEWDWESDPHGYCHDRPIYLRLIEALVASQEEVTRLTTVASNWHGEADRMYRERDQLVEQERISSRAYEGLLVERDRLAEENTRLAEKYTRLRLDVDGYELRERAFRYENERLASQVTALTEVLKFYRDPAHYARPCGTTPSSMEMDCGRRAEAALTPTDASFAGYIAEQSPDVVARRSEEAERLLGLTPTKEPSS